MRSVVLSWLVSVVLSWLVSVVLAYAVGGALLVGVGGALLVGVGGALLVGVGGALLAGLYEVDQLLECSEIKAVRFAVIKMRIFCKSFFELLAFFMLGAVCKGVAELYTHRIEEAPGLVFVTPSDDLAFINDILVVVDVAAAVFGFAGSDSRTHRSVL